MSTGRHKRLLHPLILLLLSASVQQAYALSLQQAEKLALQDDPLVDSQLATSRAMENEATAANTLPDPKFRLGMFNVPLDTFDLDQNPTTQLRLGVQQNIPRGDVLEISSEQHLLRSRAARSKAMDTQAKLLRDLRETYLNLYLQNESAHIIIDSRKLFEKLVEITEDMYAAGRAKQQDVIRAELELARLDDRHTRILSKLDQLRAKLAQWIGDSAWQDIERHFPALPALMDDEERDDINALLTQHPAILSQMAMVDAARKQTEIATQDYSPGYNAFIEYRKRFGDNTNGTERADMMAAMVTMDIPLFTENRQDKKVAASEEKANAARFELDDKLRNLKQLYESGLAMYQRASEREYLYESTLLSTARNNSESSLNAYQSGVTEFTNLMRAQITELDVRLDAIRVRVDKAIATSRLLYITGE